MNIPAERLALPTTVLLPLLAANPALSSTALTQNNIFGSGSNPLQELVQFVTGPFGYAVVIIAFVASGATLMYGGDFSGWGRRIFIAACAGGFVLLAEQVVTALFGAGTGFSVPPDMVLQAWPWPPGAEEVS
ncbi:MAG: hypothetical protein F4103_19905 [Boseongicola sp. SB0673_bin_14]|nr:hypothetical protein [Boseongicola sp. SB0667_bin_21]MYI70894.1 hypothetical protein [Boseongicola sp. SB0673_bin_14]